MTPTRRSILAGLASTAFVPANARAQSAPLLRQALDAAAATDPDEALRLLAPFDPHALQPSDRLDLITARAGLAIDAAIARSTFGRTGRSPYRVTPATGAWKAARPDQARIDADTTAILTDAEAGIVLPRLSLDRTVDALRTAPTNPAIDRQIAALESLRDIAPSAPGVGRFKGGPDWYALQLQRSLGTMTPAYAERRLFVELNRLHARATHLFDRIGASKGTVAARYAKLWQDERFLYPDTDAGRAEAIGDMNRMLATARAKIPTAFGALPPWSLNRLHARATHLFDRIGASKGTVAARYAKLWQDERFLYLDTDAGRAEAIGDMNRMLATARAKIPTAFGEVPSWCLNASARALSAEEIAAGRGGYREVPTPTRAGAYVVDLKDIRRRPRWTLPSVVAHELLPGHMIQLGLEGITPPHPLRIEYASSFVEGWGIYAEQLAEKTGAYTDPHDALGHIHWLLFRVVRALVDLGIHLHGWSIEQARERFTDWQGPPAYFAPFDVELARIPLEPGSRVAEAMAWLAIADNSRSRLPTAYHHNLLLHGRRRVGTID